MTHRGHTVVDVDAHYMEHIDDIYEYLDDDDPWKAKFGIDTGEHEPEAEDVYRQESSVGTFWPKNAGVQAPPAFQREGFHSKTDVLTTMDRLDVDKILLIGQQMLQMGSVKGDDLRPVKYARAYMRYITDNIADADAGIYVTVPVIQSDPDAASDLVETWADHDAVVGAVVIAKSGEPPFGNRRYDPIYAACQDHDLPVIFHAGGTSQDHFHQKGFEVLLETQALGFIITMMMQLTSVVIQGVPERFPDLDLIFEEAGLFYVPMLMYRLDQVYLRKPEEAPLLDQLPSKYMKEFYYGTQPMEVVPDVSYYEHIIEMLGGPERLLFATDWPHDDADEATAISDLPFLSDEEKAKVLGRNAEEVFGI